METTFNPELQLAYDFVQFTNRHIFLTGKAGTGKTTFLRNLREKSPKRMIVVAPTGVAAINAGGVTIHSFFQMPFGPHIPSNSLPDTNEIIKTRERNPAGYTKISREKINIMKSLDLLVIDEISMVRADLLDGVDEVLRSYRNRNKPFGGVQLLMIGDIQQLPPVVKEEEWDLLRPYYDTLFFFGSRALRNTDYVSIELKHIYRQSDQVFINILNKIRENKLDNGMLAELNKRYIPGFADTAGDGYIILTTHNAQAQEINDDKLNKLSSKPHTFKATVEGEFPEYAYPTDVELTLKQGAQVMFIKNDISRDKLFYNGKIGTLSHFGEGDEKGIIWVKCEDNDELIPVEPMVWENVKYTIEEETKDIKENVIGTFTQYPLKLAWAITIHKSQGLTFEKAIIDARASFAHGQVYVALSRCKTLEGMVLNRPISLQSIKNDYSVTQFSEDIEQNPPGQQQLNDSMREYQQQLILELFDFNPLQIRIYQILKHLREFSNVVFGNIINTMNSMIEKFKADIILVNDKFSVQLQQLLSLPDLPEQNKILHERVGKAAVYFLDKLNQHIYDNLLQINLETDNKEVRKTITEALDNLLTEASIKRACLNVCKEEFTTAGYLNIKAKASIEKYSIKQFTSRAEITESTQSRTPDNTLISTLKAWRNSMAQELGLPNYMILHTKVLIALTTELPSTVEQLIKIKGFGKRKAETFGNDLLEILNDYRREHDIPFTEKEILPEPAPKPKKENTRKISLNLFLAGKSIEEIAIERGYSINTIEGHLAQYVQEGVININQLVTAEKTALISEYFIKNKTTKLSPAKDALAEAVTWGELRFVMAHLKGNGLLDI